MVILCVVYRYLPLEIDDQPSLGGEIGVASVILGPDAGGGAEIRRPPVRPLGRLRRQEARQSGTSSAGFPWLCDWKGPAAAIPCSSRTTADNSLHKASTRALRTLLNMSEIIIAPPDIHWPEPPNSGWLNCAMPPRPAMSENSIDATASGLNPL